MMSITRYKDPIPDGALIVTTLDGAAFVQKTFPHAIFYPENNGHYAKDPDGTVIAVASDALCEEIDRRNAELEAKIAAGEKLTDDRLSSPEQSPFITHSSFFFRFLSYLLRIFSAVVRRLVLFSVAATTNTTTTRFNAPLLEGAIVLDTENDLRECTASHPDVDLETVDGGYTINGRKGAILAYIGDHLSKEIDERMKSLKLFENLLAEKGVSENDVFKVFEAARSVEFGLVRPDTVAER
ncbi:hypothetical protein APSETT445_005927 [Aspergillus pseudonomiae]